MFKIKLIIFATPTTFRNIWLVIVNRFPASWFWSFC